MLEEEKFEKLGMNTYINPKEDNTYVKMEYIYCFLDMRELLLGWFLLTDVSATG